MRSRRTLLTTRRLLVIALAAIALALIVIPERLTGGLISGVQILAPFIHATNGAVDTLTADIGESGVVSIEQYRAIQIRQQALENQVAALSTQAQNLALENELLTATRMWELDDGKIGARGRLIPASVMAQDLLSWRDSRLINAGSLQGVSPGDPVSTRYFSIDRGEASGIESGMGILLAETLVGVVEHVGTHTSRVRMLCDIDSQMKVRIGRFDDEGLFQAESQYYWLDGRGCNNMEIGEVDRRDIEDGLVAIGDRVLADYPRLGLTTPMVIGYVKEVLPDRDNPLLVKLVVASLVDTNGLKRVLVFDATAQP